MTRGLDPNAPLRVSFVCTGNICRSPMGEVVLRSLAADEGFGADRLVVTSRGTGGWHEGDPADPRTVVALAEHGFDGSAHRAAQVTRADLTQNHLLVALARDHERALLTAGAPRDRVVLLTAFDPDRPEDPDVFDPYYANAQAFSDVLTQVVRSTSRLLENLIPRLER